MVVWVVECAKSGKAGCKTCKEKIEKGAMRLGKESQGSGDFTVVQWYHVGCVARNAKMLKKSFDGKLEMFSNEVELRDSGFSAEDVLGAMTEAQTAEVPLSPQAANKKRQGELFDKALEAMANYPAPSPKRQKTTKAATTANSTVSDDDDAGPTVVLAGEDEDYGADALIDEKEANDDTPDVTSMAAAAGVTVNYLQAYAFFKPMKADELKDYLRWNGQILKGKRDDLLQRCADGKANGAFTQCPECEGKLQFADEGCTQVYCAGRYNDEIGAFMKCFFKCPTDKAPRQPWVSSKQEADAASAASASAQLDAGGLGGDASSLFDGIDFTSRAGRGEAATRLLGAARKAGVVLPEGDQEARGTIGAFMIPLIAGKAATDIDVQALLQAAGDKFGTRVQTEKQKATTATTCANLANAHIINQFKELARLYTLEANHNAAGTYRKVAAALSSVEFEITAGNQFHKTKGVKLEGVGATSCKLIDEIVATGTLAKIKDKREKLGEIATEG